MRILFRNIGQAELVLKTCMSTLKKALQLSPNQHVPSQRLRNAFARGLGYSSYSELQKLTVPLNSAWEPSDEHDFRESVSEGFANALKVLRDSGIIGPYHEDLPVDIVYDASEELEPVMLPDYTAGKLEMNGLLALGEYNREKTSEEDKAKLLQIAEGELRSALEFDPRLVEARLGLASIEFERQNYAKCRDLALEALNVATSLLEPYTEAIEWSSADGLPLAYLRARQILGVSFRKLGLSNEARHEFMEILKRDKADRFGVRSLLAEMPVA